MEVLGSINDGFAPPPETQDDGGWVLLEGRLAYGAQVVVPNGGSAENKGYVFAGAKQTYNYSDYYAKSENKHLHQTQLNVVVRVGGTDT